MYLEQELRDVDYLQVHGTAAQQHSNTAATATATAACSSFR